MIQGRYEEALANLNESRLGAGQIAADAIADCRRSELLATDMKRVEERTAALERRAAAYKQGLPQRSALESPVTVAAEPNSPGANAAASNTAAKPSVEERLRQLNDLFKKGLISKQEFEAKKAEIVNAL